MKNKNTIYLLIGAAIVLFYVFRKDISKALKPKTTPTFFDPTKFVYDPTKFGYDPNRGA